MGKTQFSLHLSNPKNYLSFAYNLFSVMHSSEQEEIDYIKHLREDDEKGMKLIFDQFYKYMVVTACNILGDDHKARDIAQDVLFEFWKKRDRFEVNTSLKSYLRRAVVNRSISEIRSRKKVELGEIAPDGPKTVLESSIQKSLEAEDLQLIINKAIDSLPPACRRVFALSRFEDMSHKEIAAKLEISVKTIENQITKALKVIRAATNQYRIHSAWLSLLLVIEYWMDIFK